MKLVGVKDLEYAIGDGVTLEIEFEEKIYLVNLLLENNGIFTYKIEDTLQTLINKHQLEALEDLIDGVRKFMIFR